MYKLIEFIRSTYVLVLFVALEILAFHYYANSSYVAQARLLTGSNQVVGMLHKGFSGVRHFFLLGSENERLLERIAQLESSRAAHLPPEEVFRPDSCLLDSTIAQYEFLTARVISNSINKKQNYIVLNRGRQEGVREDMSVLSSDGAMAGYVVACSAHYAVAASVLNTSFRASGRLSGGEHFGSIRWDGRSRYNITMDELSKYAKPQVGMPVVTTGFSLYFPEGVPIGKVVNFELNETRTAYVVNVQLTADLSQLRNVILVRNKSLEEIRALENDEKIEQLNQKK